MMESSLYFLFFLLPYLCTGDRFLEPLIEKRESGNCDINTKKSDCGSVGITSKKCAERSCCWKPCNTAGAACTGVPWCYHSKTMLFTKCQIAEGKKADCGYVGIKEPECTKKGCCWKPVAKQGEPWCFKARNKCTAGWRYYDGSCYYITPLTLKRDWTSAGAYCRSKGGDLVKIDSKQENQFLTSILMKLGKYIYRWIGLNDRVRENYFVWNSEKQKASYTNWRRGEPNNVGRGNGEDCAAIYESRSYSSAGLWNDIPCSRNIIAFICEMPATTGGGGSGDGSGDGSGSGSDSGSI